jgi:hypothetical protein
VFPRSLLQIANIAFLLWVSVSLLAHLARPVCQHDPQAARAVESRCAPAWGKKPSLFLIPDACCNVAIAATETLVHSLLGMFFRSAE